MAEPTKITPAVRAPWPPQTWRTMYYVNMNENFTTVANRYGVTPKNLLLFNFRTTNPYEINWYLYHYLGCRRVTDDGKNYRFSTVDIRQFPPGVEMPIRLYIPYQNWTPPPENTPTSVGLRATVLDLLDSQTALTVGVSSGAMSFRPGELALVANAIRVGRIEVRYFDSNYGWYSASNNVLTLPYTELVTVEQKGLCVHECIHALFDLKGVASTTLQSEAVAYLGQLVYYLRSGYPAITGNPGWALLKGLAGKLLTGLPLTPAEVQMSLQAVPALDKIYTTIGPPPNDGR